MKSTTIIAGLLIALAFATKAQELPIKDTSKSIMVPGKTLDKYTGHYRIEAMSVVVEITREDNGFYAIVAGMGKFLLSAGSDTTFFNNDIQAQIQFANSNEKAQTLTLFQAGQQLTGQRISPPKKLSYEKVLPGDGRIDYSKVYTPFESEWDLILRDKKVGSARIHLRHAVYQGIPAYHAGSVIRYTAMGNKPFADIGFFSKEDYRMLHSRNAISQQDEITSNLAGTTLNRSTININTGTIMETKSTNLEHLVFGGGIYKLLSMELKEGMSIQLPVSGFDSIIWEKAHIKGKEEIQIEVLNKSYNAWKVQYSSGTVKWIIDEAPYLVRWQMPTGMLWELKSMIK